MNRRGSIAVMSLYLLVGLLFFTKLIFDLVGTKLAEEKLQTACDFTLLSAQRVKSQSLEDIAERWNHFGSLITLTGERLVAGAADVRIIESGAHDLRHSISGYQGRITSAVSVAAEANGVHRLRVAQTAPAGFRLGIEPQNVRIEVPGEGFIEIDGAWYRRRWSRTDGSDVAALRMDGEVSAAAGVWPVAAQSQGRVDWDVNMWNFHPAAGNGGFASGWLQAVDRGVFWPHRFPLFRAEAGAS